MQETSVAYRLQHTYLLLPSIPKQTPVPLYEAQLLSKLNTLAITCRTVLARIEGCLLHLALKRVRT